MTDVGVVSSPADGRAYRVGESIEVDLTFSSEVRVVGRKPTLRLHIGDNTVKAPYSSGSGTNVLRFAYTVRAGDNDDNGISIPSNGPTELLARTIKSAQPDHLDVNAFHNSTAARPPTSEPTFACTEYPLAGPVSPKLLLRRLPLMARPTARGRTWR